MDDDELRALCLDLLDTGVVATAGGDLEGGGELREVGMQLARRLKSAPGADERRARLAAQLAHKLEHRGDLILKLARHPAVYM